MIGQAFFCLSLECEISTRELNPFRKPSRGPKTRVMRPREILFIIQFFLLCRRKIHMKLNK